MRWERERERMGNCQKNWLKVSAPPAVLWNWLTQSKWALPIVWWCNLRVTKISEVDIRNVYGRGSLLVCLKWRKYICFLSYFQCIIISIHEHWYCDIDVTNNWWQQTLSETFHKSSLLDKGSIHQKKNYGIMENFEKNWYFMAPKSGLVLK